MENDKPIIIEYIYSVSGKVHAIKDGLIVNTVGIWEPYYLFSKPVDNRETSFKVNYSFLFTSDNAIEIPEGFSVSECPKSVSSSKTDFGAFDIRFEQGENRLEYQLKLTAKNGVFPKNRYQAYYQFNQEILQAISPNIALTKVAE